jgi:hypothetical protein
MIQMKKEAVQIASMDVREGAKPACWAFWGLGNSVIKQSLNYSIKRQRKKKTSSLRKAVIFFF